MVASRDELDFGKWANLVPAVAPLGALTEPGADRARHRLCNGRRVLGRLEQEGYPRERRRVVASLPFSFWKGPFDRRYEGLWRARLRHAFPGGGANARGAIREERW